MRLDRALIANAALLALSAALSPVAAQDTQSGLVAPVCVRGIGECRNVAGLRFSFRDRDLQRVTGLNVTIWGPHKPTEGTIKGIAVGVLGTGGEYITGLGVAPLLLTTRTRFSGIAASGLGYGFPGQMRGIAVSGLGGWVGEELVGLAASGVGVVVGGEARGIILSGLGGAVGGRLQGLAVGGLGFAASGGGEGLLAGALAVAVAAPFRGIALAGVAVGGSGSITGITIAGLGAASGGSLRGISVAGLGVGAAESLDGVSVAGIGLAAPSIKKLAIAAAVGTVDARAIVIAPVYFRAAKRDGDGSAHGLFVSSVNDVRGEMRGVAIGIINYARSLHGVQIGLLNIVTDGRGPRMLPVINWR